MNSLKYITLLPFLFILVSCATYKPPVENGQPLATLKLENWNSNLGHTLNPFATHDKFLVTEVDGKSLSGYNNQYVIRLTPGKHSIQTICQKEGLALYKTTGMNYLNVNAKAGYTYIAHLYPKGEQLPANRQCQMKIDQVIAP